MHPPIQKVLRYEAAKRRTELSQPCVDVLLALKTGGLSMAGISEQTGVIVPTLRRHVADLRKSGLIIRITDPDNLKKVSFEISAAGAKLIDSILSALK